MSDDLRSSWKQTGKALGGAFKSLGKSLLRTGKKVVAKIDDACSESDSNQDDSTCENKGD